MTSNHDWRRRITATITTDLVVMDTVIDDEIVIRTYNGVVNVEIFKRYFKPLVCM